MELGGIKGQKQPIVFPFLWGFCSTFFVLDYTSEPVIP